MTPRASLVALPILLAQVPMPLPSTAPRRGPAVEKAICPDPALKAVDDELGAAYGALKAALAEADQKMMTMSQKRWIAQREDCGSEVEDVTACVKEKTAERLALIAGRRQAGRG